MKTKIPIPVLGAVVIALVWLAACSQAPVAPTVTSIPSTDTAIPPTLTPLPTATPAPSPTGTPALSPGTYQMTMTALEAHRLAPQIPQQYVGNWLVQLVLTPADGRTGAVEVSVIGFSNYAQGPFPGTYSLDMDAHQFTMILAYCGSRGDGLYDWTFDGTTLVFKAVEDRCSDRQTIMTIHPWTKQP